MEPPSAPDSWLPIVFNPSFPFRLVHTVIAAYLTTSLVVEVGAWHLLADRANLGARRMFSMAMWMAAIVAPIQILAGDTQGLNTLEHRPAKVLAMEGDYAPSPHGAPLVLFGLPSNAQARVRYRIEVPHVGSLILKHDPNAALPGLTDFPRDKWPPVPIVFWSFRVMVGLGLAMLGLGLWSLVARARRRLYDWRWLHRAAVLMGPATAPEPLSPRRADPARSYQDREHDPLYPGGRCRMRWPSWEEPKSDHTVGIPDPAATLYARATARYG